MALSSVSYTGDGTTRLFAVTIPYLAKAHVKVYVGGVEDTTFTWTTASSITTTGTPALSAIVLIKRTTPTTPLVDFVDGSTLTESLLDTSNLQNLYVSEETQDTATSSLVLDSTDNKFNANSKVIKNLATPVNGNDAVNKTYVDSTIPTSVAAAASSASSAASSASSASASAAAAATFDPTSYLPKSGGSLTGYINEARGTVTMNATTMDLWAQPNTIDGSGSAVTITAIANAPQAGAKRTLYPITGTVITNGATFAVDGNAAYTTAAGDALEFEAVTTSTYKVHITKKDGTAVVGGTQTSKIQSVGYSLAANALTLTLEPTSLDFRSTTLTTGAPTTVTNAAQINTTISSGSTGGTVSAVQSDIYILAINNAGTMELAWCNASGGINLDETTLISTTAEGGAGAADSATVIYSTTARSNIAFRVVGLFRSTQTTAGTWAQTPSLVQGYGGQALAAMSSLGYGQTPQNVKGSRAAGTTYYNTTGKPIIVNIQAVVGTAVAALKITTLGIDWVGPNNAGAGGVSCVTAIITPGASYVLGATLTGTVGAIGFWTELR